MVLLLGLGTAVNASNAVAEMLGADAVAPAEPSPDEATGPGDPLEPMNRAIFGFNEELDNWVLQPVASTWDFIAPTPIERGIENFYNNLLFPVRFVNLLLQGELDPAALALSRFCVNTTLGIGGIFDAATFLDLERQRADFGQTLGKWGVPPGPYMVFSVRWKISRMPPLIFIPQRETATGNNEKNGSLVPRKLAANATKICTSWTISMRRNGDSVRNSDLGSFVPRGRDGCCTTTDGLRLGNGRRSSRGPSEGQSFRGNENRPDSSDCRPAVSLPLNRPTGRRSKLEADVQSAAEDLQPGIPETPRGHVRQEHQPL